VSGTLEELWISYNLLDKLAGIEKLTNLKVLYMSNNLLAKWSEVDHLKECPVLHDVLLQANPIEVNTVRKDDYRLQFIGRASHVAKFDGVPVNDEERHIGYQFILGQQLIARFGNVASVFKKIDLNGDGLLSREELERAIRNVGFPYEEDELNAFMRSADLTGTGLIRYEELCARFTDLNVVDDKG